MVLTTFFLGGLIGGVACLKKGFQLAETRKVYYSIQCEIKFSNILDVD